MEYNTMRMKKVVRKVKFASFNLNKDRTGSFDEVKSVKVSTDHELLLQIVDAVKGINTRLDRVEDVLKRNNLK
ncbi:MAG: hypothetical protein LBP70_01420 [Mycoplasmataceae bacterium]|jgi:hypothetical protein|nr:hypothetical protein [Mycoplasmataceae bacterium]